MTHVEIVYDNNIIIGFKMKGHAEFNTKGPDILCASLSTASQMTINGVLDWTGLSVQDTIKEYSVEEAILEFNVDGFCESSVVQHLFKSFEMYVCALENQYEKFVKVERRQKHDNKD